LPSPLKSPMAMAVGLLPALTSAALVKPVTPVHAVPVCTVKVKIRLVVPPLLNAVTVTVYAPLGCASVTCTTPVAGSAANVPLKLLLVPTLILVVLVGAAAGVIAWLLWRKPKTLAEVSAV